MSPLSIGEVAARSGIGVETLRYYEREGLLPSPARKPSGYRMYEPGIVARLRFIRRAKTLGFSLEEIRQLLVLQDQAPGGRAHVKAMADAKIAALEAKIRDLKRMRTALTRLSASCSGAGPISGCPIIEALQGDD